MTALQNRYDFVFLFDITNGNPNGDPDNGNMPRLDTATQNGLVTDVCLKRKVRNYVSAVKGGAAPFAIYMQERAVLNALHQGAYDALKIKSESKKLPKDEAKARELTGWMCANYFDIRAFGAVMTTEVNCGQVRGPIQMTFSQSVESIVPQEVTITRSSVTNERDADKERTMGRKYIVPYGLYRGHGFVSANLAGDPHKGTGLSTEDIDLFWEALGGMFEHDRSAARGEMCARKLVLFKHDSALGRASAHGLFDRVKIGRNVDGQFRALDDRGIGNLPPARKFSDYIVAIERDGLPEGVEIIEKV